MKTFQILEKTLKNPTGLRNVNRNHEVVATHALLPMSDYQVPTYCSDKTSKLAQIVRKREY